MPVLGTKLHLPAPRSQLVARARLTDSLRLVPGSMPRLVLVAAPAGFGKTTLVTQWLAGRPASVGVAWLSLDATDSDLVRFLTQLVTAAQRANPDVADEIGTQIGTEALTFLDAARGQACEPALVSLVNDLDTLAGATVVALDDYHLIEAPAVHEAVTFLVDHLPAHVTLAITTRADPPLPLARLRARGELVEVRASDLRFTSEEAAEFLNQVMGLDLDPASVDALEARTEGWAAGLQLAALSVRSRADADDDQQAVSRFVEAFTGSNRFVLDYLVEEVLAGVSDHARQFLLATCVLEQLTGPLCDTLTGRRDGAQTLDQLDRGNLFLVPLDDRRQWYRYHHLFRDVLRARLLADHPERLTPLHQAASDWYACQDLPEDAVRHALSAADHDRAAYLMESALPELRRHRQDHVLIDWAESLPEDVIRRRPVLAIMAGWTRMIAGDLDGMQRRLDDAEAALAAAARDPAVGQMWADTEDLRTAPATVWLYRAALAQARDDIQGTMRHARRAFELSGPEDHFVRGGAVGFLGLAAWAAGDVDVALTTFSDAVRSLHAAGNLVDELDATVVLGDMWITAGRPDRARGLYERALATATGAGEPYPRATPDLHVCLAELDCQLDDLVGARAHLAAAQDLSKRGSITENRHRWYLAAAKLHAATGDHGAVDRLLDQAEALYRPGSYPDVRPLGAVRARLHLTAGELEAAEAWAIDHRESSTDAPTFLDEYNQLTLVRVLLARHRARPSAGELAGHDQALPRAVESILDRFEAAAEPARAGSLLEIGVLRALNHDAHGRAGEALATLDQALTRAPNPDSFVRLFLDEGEPMLTLLRRAAQDQEGKVPGTLRRHASRLLDAHQNTRIRHPVEAAERAVPADDAGRPADPLSERELEVLRLLDSTLTGPEIARRLYVSLNTFRTHTKRIFTKLDVNNRAAAVQRGRDLNLL